MTRKPNVRRVLSRLCLSIHVHAVYRDWREWRAADDAVFSRVLWRELHLNSTPHLLDLEGIPRALAALRGGHMKGKCIALIDPQSIEL